MITSWLVTVFSICVGFGVVAAFAWQKGIAWDSAGFVLLPGLLISALLMLAGSIILHLTGKQAPIAKRRYQAPAEVLPYRPLERALNSRPAA